MIIAVLNQKGGVGKSTVTCNLAYALAKAGKETLIVDLDPQAHSTVIYMPEKPDAGTVNDIIRDKKFSVEKAIYPAMVEQEVNGEEELVKVEKLSIMPSNIHLAASSESILSRMHREKILHNKLRSIENEYDFILLDCPPTLGVLTVNAVYAAEMTIIPTKYSKYSLDGISDLFNVIEEVKETDDFDYMILRNSKDTRSTRTNEAIEDQLQEYEENMFKTIIRRSEAINQAQMINQPIYVYDARSTGVKDFEALSKEVMTWRRS